MFIVKIRMTFVVALVMVLTATGLWATGAGEEPAAAADRETVFDPATGNESPMLAALVASGDLPPVHERLPNEPFVMEPVEQIGKYGGTLRVGDAAVAYLNGFASIHEIGLFRYNMSASAITPDIAKSFSWSSDIKTLTIELREGHKWSDGHPFTVDDIIFWWEDVQLNEELRPGGPRGVFKPRGELAEFKKISDTVLEMSFSVPHPTVMDFLGRPKRSADPFMMLPKHYLEKWHIDYNPDANKLAEEEGFDDWAQAFTAHYNSKWQLDPNQPTLRPWIATEEQSGDRIFVERNPYFHHVDPEGNQLPYIDRIEDLLTGNVQIQTLKASAGEFDIASYYLALADLEVLKANEVDGDYRILFPKDFAVSSAALFPNQNAADPELRDLFQNRDFRVALSLSLDRENLNETLFFGLGTAYPGVPPPYMSFFQPEWESPDYIQYDPERANEILDSLGLTERDDEGFRLRRDGEGRLSILVNTITAHWPEDALVMEVIKNDLAAVGIEIIHRPWAESAPLAEAERNNDLEMYAWYIGTNAFQTGRPDPGMWGFMRVSEQYWAPLWVRWFETGGEEGEEPPARIKELREIYEQYLQTPIGSAEYNILAEEYFSYFYEELPLIATVGFTPRPMVVSNRLRNVPEEDLWWGPTTGWYEPYMPTQWYIEE